MSLISRHVTGMTSKNVKPSVISRNVKFFRKNYPEKPKFRTFREILPIQSLSTANLLQIGGKGTREHN